MAIITADILHDAPRNPGGVKEILYWQEVRNVDTFPAIDFSSALDFQSATQISADIVLAASTKFHKLYSTQDTAMVEFPIVGETDGKAPRSRLTIFHPGSDSDIFGFVNAMPNANFIFLAPANNGLMYIVGTPDNPAKLAEGEGSSGEGYEGRAGFTLTFQANHGPLLYTGTIDEDDQL